MPLNETPCPRCSRRVHVMAGINVLPNFPQSVFLVCWKCKIIAHPREDRKWITIKEAKAVRQNSAGTGTS